MPALAILGIASICIATVLVDEGQTPLVIVHMKMFCPITRPLTVTLFEERAGVIVPLPETKDHVPDPIDGLFALSVVVVIEQRS